MLECLGALSRFGGHAFNRLLKSTPVSKLSERIVSRAEKGLFPSSMSFPRHPDLLSFLSSSRSQGHPHRCDLHGRPSGNTPSVSSMQRKPRRNKPRLTPPTFHFRPQLHPVGALPPTHCFPRLRKRTPSTERPRVRPDDHLTRRYLAHRTQIRGVRRRREALLLHPRGQARHPEPTPPCPPLHHHRLLGSSGRSSSESFGSSTNARSRAVAVLDVLD